MENRTATQSTGMPEELLAAVAAEASANAGTWFPELDPGRVEVRAVSSDDRARCFLHRVELDDGRTVRPVVVKVRHSQADLRRLDRFESRPVLNPERTMSDEESARREYDALRDIAEALDGAPESRFGVLRPLAWLPAEAGIVMDLVGEPTLRDRLLRTSRLRRRALPPMPETPWRNAGEWLRLFHDHGTSRVLPSRMGTRDEVAALLRADAEFLSGQIGARPVLRRVQDAADDLAAALPGEMPLAPGHGDFVANNMFSSDTGRVTVFDPLPRWRVPRYQDLATLTMGLRVIPVHAATQGRALLEADLSRYENAVLHGYYGDEVPLAAVRVYQLLVLLDRWVALTSKTTRAGAARSRVRDVRVKLTSRYFSSECSRVTRALAPST